MVFVTGGTGLIGSHLLFELVQKEEKVRAIYRNPNAIDKVLKLFKYYNNDNSQFLFDKIEWVSCDILDVVTLDEVIKDCSDVYHCAALVSFHRNDFNQLMKINREGTANIVNACLDNNIRKLAYVSSTAAIGGANLADLVTEDLKWKQSENTSGYAISKYSAEKEVWRGVEEGLDIVIVNPSVVIGAGNWNESSLTIFKTIENGLKFYTSGSNAFVDARDVTKTLVQLMESEIKNERFLCVGENAKFIDLFHLISKRIDKKPPYILVQSWLASLTWRVAALVSLLTGKRSTITKESATSAFNVTKYSNTKIKTALNHEFYTLEQMVDNAVNGRL